MKIIKSVISICVWSTFVAISFSLLKKGINPLLVLMGLSLISALYGGIKTSIHLSIYPKEYFELSERWDSLRNSFINLFKKETEIQYNSVQTKDEFSETITIQK